MILVTGGNGFLGQEIVKQLLKNGHKILSLSRKFSPVLSQWGVEQLSLDLSKISAQELAQVFLKYKIKQCIHTAAKAGMDGSYKEFYLANVKATKILIQALKTIGVRDFVYTSSPSVVFGTQALENADETTPYPVKHLCHYATTKAEAERFVLSSHTPSIFHVISLRPHLIWGPGDPHLLPALLKLSASRFFPCIGSGMNLVDVIHVQNAAHAHVLSLQKLQENPECPEPLVYFLAQERPVPLWPFMSKLVATQNREWSPTWSLSKEVAYFFAHCAEVLSLFLPFYRPKLSRFVVLNLALSHYFSQRRALTQLQYTPQLTIEEGLATLRRDG
jgi:nucleoside-diphosphate-sugar epimerase